MKLFWKYLKQRRKLLGLLALFAGIFLATFALYQLPLEAVAYPIILCGVVGCVFMMVDFLHIKKNHSLLEDMKEFIDILHCEFPVDTGIENEDYIRIINLLRDEYIIAQDSSKQKYADIVDYYTLWVHQIKTPIASMRLTLQNEDTALARQLKADLFRIEQYVEMVLVYLRLDSEGSDYVIREYDVDDLIRSAVKKFSGEFIGRKISLIYEPIQKRIITDEKWFSFVLEQLLSNALKYTYSGSITIKMEEDQLWIQDTGIGIKAEDLPRIFEKGFTGYNGRTDKRASGIGLYLCKCICGNLGHSIKAESIIGKGTTIKINLSQNKLGVE